MSEPVSEREPSSGRDLTTAELVERVREALTYYVPSAGRRYHDALAALSELEERLEAARAGDEKYGEVAMTWRTRAEAAERERDELREVAHGQTALVNSAEARVRELEEALRGIDWIAGSTPTIEALKAIQDRARAALATASGKEEG